MSEDAQQALIEEFGLDQSKLTQYGLYMKELLHGNMGTSFAKRIPVSQYIAEKLPWTLLLLAAVMPEREGEVKIVFTSGEGLQESVVLKI